MDKSKNPAISVIVPMYNTEKYISKCLTSIIDQTFSDFEVLIIDDGSTDHSCETADFFAKTDARFKIIHTKNGGVSRARNIGLKQASGEYISFIDSDDAIRPQMYEMLLSKATEYNVEIVSSDLIINGKTIENNIPKDRPIYKNEIFEKVLPLFSVTNSIGTLEFKNKIFRRDLLLENGILFEEGFSFQEDLMFMINVYANARSLYYLPEAFYEYVPLSTGLYASYRKDGGMKFVKARKIISGLIDRYGIPNIDRNQLNNGFLYNISFYIYRTQRLKDRKISEKLISEVLNDDCVISCCRELKLTAASFDKRIASAIADKKKRLAVFLINFVYSGKAEKLQRIIAKVRNKG